MQGSLTTRATRATRNTRDQVSLYGYFRKGTKAERHHKS